MASVAYVEETLRSTKEKANFQRLTRLLMYGGIQLLRENFDSCHPPADLPLKLADPAIQAKLRTAKLLPPEWRILYPSPGVFGKSSDFDITLTFRLLRTICGLTAPSTGWNSLPANTDRNIEADLVRIKFSGIPYMVTLRKWKLPTPISSNSGGRSGKLFCKLPDH